MQSEVPHQQGIALAELPSVVVHCTVFLQELMDDLQNIPVVAVQSDVPHWQSVPAVLAVAPLVIMQVVPGRFVHVLDESVQYNPAVGVQSEVPHLHAVLAVAPLVIGHGSTQLISSFATAGAYLPVTQVSHEAEIENGAFSGLDMYLPAGQQPRRPLPS